MLVEKQLDVSEMAAPEPLVESIRALEDLLQGEWLHLFHRMKPCKLYDFLHSHGYHSITCEGSTVACEVFIWKAGDHDAELAAQTSANKLKPWKD